MKFMKKFMLLFDCRFMLLLFDCQFMLFLFDCQVPKRYYDDCSLPEDVEEAQLGRYGIETVKNCSSPYEESVFTSYIDEFVALPGSFGGLSYSSGQEYYFTCKQSRLTINLL